MESAARKKDIQQQNINHDSMICDDLIVIDINIIVCVCVCVRERERDENKHAFDLLY